MIRIVLLSISASLFAVLALLVWCDRLSAQNQLGLGQESLTMLAQAETKDRRLEAAETRAEAAEARAEVAEARASAAEKRAEAAEKRAAAAEARAKDAERRAAAIAGTVKKSSKITRERARARAIATRAQRLETQRRLDEQIMRQELRDAGRR